MNRPRLRLRLKQKRSNNLHLPKHQQRLTVLDDDDAEIGEVIGTDYTRPDDDDDAPEVYFLMER